LKARIRALLRRGRAPSDGGSGSENQDSLLTVGSLSLDLHAYQVHVGGKIVQLTPTEFDLLYHLMTHPGEVFSSPQLLQQVWGYPPSAGDPSTVRWHIKNLRAKIEPDPSHPVYICTVPRHGYMFDRRGPS